MSYYALQMRGGQAVLRSGNAGVPGWVPPIGIPTPPFGLTEVAPAVPDPWITPTEGFYYVNGSTGNDSGNSFGTPGSPRASIPTTLPAGAVVELHGANPGSYAGGITINGTFGAPVFIRGESPSAKPTIGGYWFLSGSYVILENLEFAAAGAYQGINQLYLIGPIDHVAVRACDVHGALDHGGIFVGTFAEEDPASQIVIYNNILHDNGDVSGGSGDQDAHGVAVGAVASHVWIVDNTIYLNSGDGVQINAGQTLQATTHHIYVGRNTSYENRQTGMWCKQAVDVIFSQNTCYGHRDGASSDGAGMGTQYGPERCWFLFNRCYDNNVGIHGASISGLGTGTNLYLIGNLIHGNVNDTANGGISIWAFPTVHLINNTVADCAGDGISFPTNSDVDARIMNNIVTGRTNAAAYDVFFENGTMAAASEIQNTLLYAATGERIGWAHAAETLAAFQARTGKGENCLATDPLLVGGGDYSLQVSSPAKDAGVVDAVYATFLSLYGIDLAKDIRGIARPQGAAWDMGAYER